MRITEKDIVYTGICAKSHGYVIMLVTQSCQTLCDSMDYSPPGSSVQARILECCHFLLQGIFPTQ